MGKAKRARQIRCEVVGTRSLRAQATNDLTYTTSRGFMRRSGDVASTAR